ncbi:hypothetical protein ES319_A01G007600v1 [Gossypium barbadense]|uniref:Cyclase family protein n=2 Tax=Gossypium TaxID=3633 RepID=A0A5J5WR16_GOSBA|nr:hypothetical protein ES319_A01G007600v1 [Gossypium barbadense]TYH29421.1 hypothetical protein ES288_A01G010100v1 [Gossypium darwinii]
MTKTMFLPLLLLLLSAAAASTSVSTECTVSTMDDYPVPVRREVYGDGRIFDISHRYTMDMPSWERKDGLGRFLWLPASMKNGSLANNSLMKLPTHSGTHVDAPGHMIDRYFDAGFDVDTLDLEVLNGPALLVDVPRDSNITGVDFLSVACEDHLVSAHLEFFESREVILVEGLKLDDVPTGIYNVHCLPLRLPGAEGSPIRCILIK